MAWLLINLAAFLLYLLKQVGLVCLNEAFLFCTFFLLIHGCKNFCHLFLGAGNQLISQHSFKHNHHDAKSLKFLSIIFVKKWKKVKTYSLVMMIERN